MKNKPILILAIILTIAAFVIFSIAIFSAVELSIAEKWAAFGGLFALPAYILYAINGLKDD